MLFFLNQVSKSPVCVSSEDFFQPWSLFQPKYFDESGSFFKDNLTFASQTVSVYVVPAQPHLYIASLFNFIVKKHLKGTASKNIVKCSIIFSFTCSDKLLEK